VTGLDVSLAKIMTDFEINEAQYYPEFWRGTMDQLALSC
jgi:hypothetical protein